MSVTLINNVLITALFGVLIFNTSFAQSRQVADSLITVLETQELSKKEHSKLLNSLAYHHPKIDTALLVAKQALQIAEEIKDPVLEGEALEEISNIERRLGNNSVSLQASFKALQIYESLELTERQAASYGQLASNSVSDDDYPSAISYLKKAQRIYKNSDKIKNETIILVNLGEAYRLAGYLDSATTCFKETLTRSMLKEDGIIKAYSQGNLGMVYAAQGKLELAKTNLNEATATLLELGDSYATTVYTAELGEVYQKEDKPQAAEEKFLQAVTMAKQAGLKEQVRDFSATLSDFYEASGNYAQALKFQKLYQVYQDSLVNKENIQKIEQLKSGYEIGKRESEIDLLNTINTNQKYLVITLGTGAFLLLLFAYLLYRVNSKVKKNNQVLAFQKTVIEKREEEKALLLRELNHRVKNNLQMISSLLSLQSRELTGHPAQEAITAGKYRVEALSLVHRKLYQKGVDTKVKIRGYIEELVLGLFHGYGASFKPDFDIADIGIKIDTAVPLALIINELVTNSLNHAYKNIANPVFNVKMTQVTEGRLFLQISDNGSGFSTAEKEKVNSFGIKLVASLIEQLDGTIEKLNVDGTHWNIDIKLPDVKSKNNSAL